MYLHPARPQPHPTAKLHKRQEVRRIPWGNPHPTSHWTCSSQATWTCPGQATCERTNDYESTHQENHLARSTRGGRKSPVTTHAFISTSATKRDCGQEKVKVVLDRRSNHSGRAFPWRTTTVPPQHQNPKRVLPTRFLLQRRAREPFTSRLVWLQRAIHLTLLDELNTRFTPSRHLRKLPHTPHPAQTPRRSMHTTPAAPRDRVAARVTLCHATVAAARAVCGVVVVKRELRHARRRFCVPLGGCGAPSLPERLPSPGFHGQTAPEPSSVSPGSGPWRRRSRRCRRQRRSVALHHHHGVVSTSQPRSLTRRRTVVSCAACACARTHADAFDASTDW